MCWSILLCMDKSFPKTPETVFESSVHNGVYTVSSTGGNEIDVYTASSYREKIIEAYSSEDCTAMVLDVSNVTYMDATGIGVMIGALKRCRSIQRPLAVVCWDNSHVHKVLRVTGANRVFQLILNPKQQRIEDES